MTTGAEAVQPRLLVGVGASAGGLDAFKQLLSAIPSESGMAFLLVQHLDPNHESLLRELLASFTELDVREADHGLELRRDTVYVIRPGTALGVRGGKIELSSPTLHRGIRLPVDHLFRSLAREYGARAAGIVLSGAGSDGSAGLRSLKAAGGLTIAQEPSAAGQPGMPQAAVDTGMVDLVLGIPDMPAALERFAALPVQAQPEHARPGEAAGADRSSGLSEPQLARLAALIEAQRGFDLRIYKSTTVERRLLRRMALSGFEEVETYLDHLRSDAAEQQTLLRDLLISVTDFFRDPDAFQELRRKVIDPLVLGWDGRAPLRVWVPGCATGEEAYSLGMELLDAIAAADKRIPVQIFATDIDQDALAFARAALYPPSVAERVSPRRLEAYFKAVDGRGYQVRAQLRDVISFAAHDLTKDPPFSRMSLVSCRNVLIYLTAEAQRHVLRHLHFALEPGGHLFLSTSESTVSQREHFSTISKSQRIYRKVGESQRIAIGRARAPQAREAPAPPAAAVRRGSQADLARRAVLDAWVPPSVMVTADGAVTFMHGDLGPYLQFPQGEDPRFEIGAVLRPELATRARGALYKCRRTRQEVVAFSSPAAGAARRVRITAKPVASLGDDAVILSFEDVELGGAGTAERPETSGHEAVIEELERELQATREDLRNTVEELETSNEELRSSNEESTSTNEELQSANEELEATTEELRSLNEELATVNAQLREKFEQLEQSHDDLQNFFASTKIATVFLDERLCIKRFTPAAREILGIDHADVGRRVGDIARELLQNDLEREAKEVLEHLRAGGRELRTAGGRWISRQVLPYRTESRRIEGVVVTFADVTELRAANEALEVKSRRLELAWEAARGGIFEHRVPLDESTYHSDQWAQILGYRREELPPYDRFLEWLSERVHPDDRARLDEAYAAFVAGRSERYHAELRLRHRAGHWLWVRGISKALERAPDGSVRHVLGMMIDITDLKQVEEALRESEARFREMAEGMPLMVWVHDAAGQQEWVNETFCRFFGVTREEMTGGRWQMLVHPEDVERYAAEFREAVRDRRPFHAEARVRRGDGEWRRVESWGRVRWTAAGEFRGVVGTSADVTERRRIEAELRDSEERFRNLADNIVQLAWMAQRDGEAVWYNKRWYDYTGSTFEEMKGWGWRSVHHPDHVERVTEKVRRCFRAGETWEDTFPLRGADGTYRWFLSRAVPIRDEGGAILRWFGTNTDITEQREAEQKLVEADRQKDEFIAMLGHELRNPLAAIRNAWQLVKPSCPDEPRLRRAQAVIERQSAHMVKLIDGLLDVSRIIRGKIRLDTEIVDLSAVCREVATDVGAHLTRREQTLRTDLPPAPLWVEGDRVRLAQIVDNLLSNAVKYTGDGGTITLSLRREDGGVVLSVRDTGVGIEPALLPHVFETFRQSAQSMDRSYGGLGLGLALVKTLADLHGGRVEARSEGPGRGSEFVLRLPLAARSAPPPGGAREGSAAPLRILLVEDSADNAEMLRQVLELDGHEVLVAAEGPEGAALARERPLDVVLCDLGLPGGMNGYDVARALRADPALRRLTLVALSGYGRPEDKERSAEVGFDLHLTKPVDLELLRRVLAQVGGAERPPGGRAE